MTSIERVHRDETEPSRVYWIFSLASIMREYATAVAVDTEHRLVSWRSIAGPDHSGQATMSEHGTGETAE
jgi:hypothetical protein